MYYIPDNSKLISNLYEDLMNIYRWQNLPDPVTGMTRPQLTQLATGVACGLSFKNNYSSEDFDPSNNVSTDPMVFADYKVDLEFGDILEVTTRSGKVYNVKCSEPLYYGGSHVQVTCERYEDEIEVS